MKKNLISKSSKKELETFFYKGVLYIISKDKFSAFKDSFGNFLKLSDGCKLRDFLDKKRIGIPAFLELISVCWIKA